MLDWAGIPDWGTGTDRGSKGGMSTCRPRTGLGTYTPTLESSLAGNLMTGAPVKIRNFTTKQRIFMRKKELGKVNPFLSSSNLLFLSFKVVV